MPPGFDYPGGSDFWTARELSPPQTSRTAHNFTRRRARVERRRRQRGPERDRRPLAGAEAASRRRHVDVRRRGRAPARVAHGDVASGPAAALRRRGPAPRDRLPQRVEPAPGARLDAPARAGPAAGGRRGPRPARRDSSSPRRSCCRWRRASSGSPSRLPASGRSPRCSRPTSPASPTSASTRAFSASRSLVAVGTAALLGILTSLRTSPTKLREALGEGQRTMGGGRGERARQGLVVAQVALTMVLLVGAGLLARSFMQVLAVDPGYSTANALVLDLIWPFTRDARAAAAARRQPARRADRAGAAAGCRPRRTHQLVSTRPRLLPQRPLHRDDAARRVRELRRHQSARRRGQGPLRPGGVPHRERRLLCGHGHPAHPRPAVRAERRPRRAARRGHQRVAGEDQVAGAGRHRPVRAVRQHGRRPARLSHRRHRRRRARDLPGGGARADVLRLLPAAADVARQHRRQERGADGADGRGTANRADGRSGGPAPDPARSRTRSTARSRAGGSACSSSASSAPARWCWRRSASTG